MSLKKLWLSLKQLTELQRNLNNIYKVYYIVWLDAPTPSWENLEAVMKAVKTVVRGLVDFIQSSGSKKVDNTAYVNVRYKTSMCRDLSEKGRCPRGTNCTFAHSQEELEKYESKYLYPIDKFSSINLGLKMNVFNSVNVVQYINGVYVFLAVL